MTQVNVTELRQHLPDYLERVKKGEEVQITVHGKVVARLIPEAEQAEAARKWLIGLRGKCRIGDVISPSGEAWNAERGRY
ncbi:MAG: type II toxin-antitoxin system Phd/YefM family antitoxin [Betaproteobacteria bacterium]|nr:type II toxin-antitoxin system Phd/YefM family antitoxin [Betaproteobacteria bacterium]